MKGACDGTVTKRASWGGKPYKIPCDKAAAFALGSYPEADHVIEACRIHLPDLVTRMVRNHITPSVDVRPVTK